MHDDTSGKRADPGRRRAWRRTLAWRYTATFGGLVVVLLVLGALMQAYFSWREASSALQQAQRLHAAHAAEAIASFVERTREALSTSALKLDAAAAADGDELLQHRVELATAMRHRPEIVELRWIGSDGSERLAMTRFGPALPGARDWRESPLIAAAMATREAVVGPVDYRKQTEPYAEIAAARGRGGVLLAQVDLRPISETIARTAATAGLAIFVVDAAGQLIAHSDVRRVLAREDASVLPQVQRLRDPAGIEPSSGHSLGLDGVAVITNAAPVAALGWTVFVEQPAAEALQPVYRTLWRSAALLLLGLVVAAATSVWLARRMVRPIRRMHERAAELGEGRFDARIGVSGEDELAALAAQFDRLAGDLQRLHDAQEQRIAERTAALARANESKTRFLAAASHDLRQPIHALTLFIGQLRAEPLDGEPAALVRSAERSVHSLTALLDALLDLSRIDAGVMQPEPRSFELRPVLQNLVSQFGPIARARGLRLRLARGSAWVHSDPLMVERIAMNLLSNAVRYTARGGIVVGCRRRGDAVELCVIDTGVGIAADRQARVFEAFYRDGPRSGTGSDGLGLGLSIVKGLAELLGHRLHLQSAPGRGTSVRLELPRCDAPADRHELAASASALTSLDGRRVLVVDNDQGALEAMRRQLAAWGCQVRTARGADEAWAMLRETAPEVLLCDLELGESGGEGCEIVHQLPARMPAGRRAPRCAFVTGTSSAALLAQARATGCPVLLKPTPPAKLRALLEHLLHAVDADDSPAIILPSP